jgi:CBS domain-containing protein
MSETPPTPGPGRDFNEEVIVVTPDSFVLDACKAMRDSRVNAVVVAVGRRVVGILTERDVVKALNRGQACTTTPVADVMTPNPVCVTPECANMSALQRMARGQFRHLPVVASLDTLELVGLYEALKLVS